MSFHEWWSISCKFDRSVYLRKNLACRSLLKVGDNYWMQEEPEHAGEGDYVDAFVQKLELDESAIMEVSLCDNSEFMAFITKKF